MVYPITTKANKLGDKRFTAVDPVKGSATNPQSMVQYTYVLNNPVMYIDPLGLAAQLILRDANSRQVISSGVIGDERYLDSGYIWLRDAQNAFNQNGLSIKVNYTSENNSVQVITNRYGVGSHALTVSIDALARQVRGQALEDGKGSGVYMQLYNCLLPGRDRTYVNLAQFANLYNLEAMVYPLGDRSDIEDLMSYLDYGYAAGNYVITTIESAGAGHWYDGEDTALTPWAQVLAAVTNADAPTNVANIIYDIENWQWTWEHAGNTAIDVAAVTPLGSVMGVVKGGKLVGVALTSGDEVKLITGTASDAAQIIKKAEFKKPVSGKTGKEAAKDVPSWAKGYQPYKGENGNAFATRLMDEKYGRGNYDKGPGSEYNKIRKWGDRGFE